MPRQQATLCSRLVRRQISSCPDGVWIRDGVLALAFERYCNVSKYARRMASTVPGPMESRRRLGKRHMTDLGVQVHPSLPPWALPNPPDLTQWQWKPPEHPDSRSRKDREALATLQSWLSRLGGRHEEKATKNEADQISEDKTEAAPGQGQIVQPFLAELDALRVSFESAPLDRLVPHFREVCLLFQQQLALATLSLEQVSSVIDTLLDGLDLRFPRSAQGVNEEHYLRLFSSVVTGITSCRVLRSEDLGASFWSSLLLRISHLSPGNEFCLLLERIMSAIPPKFASQMSEAVLSVLNGALSREATGTWRDVGGIIGEAVGLSRKLSQVLSSAEALVQEGLHSRAESAIDTARALHRQCTQLMSMSDSLAAGSDQSGTMARAFHMLNPEKHAELLDGVTDRLLNESIASPEQHSRAVHYWLSLLAHMPHINQDYLFQTLQRWAESRNGLDISDTELCELLICQWRSRGYRATGTSFYFQQIKASQGEACDDKFSFAMLALALRQSNPRPARHGHFHSLWKCLRALGREAQFLDSLAALGNLPEHFLEDLAWASNDIPTVVHLHSLYSGRREWSMPLWNPASWDRYATRLAEAMDVTLTAQQIYGALDMWAYSHRVSQTGTNRMRQRRKVGPETVALVEKLAVRLAHAADLSNRQAFERVSRCWTFLRFHGHVSSPTVVGALFRVLTIDLALGDLGSTRRLRWFLSVVMKQHNEQIALDCGLALKRWRDANRRLLRLEQNLY